MAYLFPKKHSTGASCEGVAQCWLFFFTRSRSLGAVVFCVLRPIQAHN